jgi:signal transduction histidine kinase
MQMPDAEETLMLRTDDTFDAREIHCLEEVISTRKSLLIRDIRDYPGWTPVFTREIIRNWLGIPMLTGGNTIGVLALANTRPDVFSAEHVRLAEAIVAQAAVAIQNAWLFEQVRAGHERLQSLSRRLVEVQESERRYIARELHDEASQALTALMFGLSLLEQDANQPEILQKRVAELKRLTDGVLEDLHRLAIGLRPASLDYLGLVPALEQLVQTSAERYPVNFRFKTAGLTQEDRLPDYVETSLYRIVQEALTNAVRYAKAQNIDVILELRDGKVLVMVEDDGVGFETAEMHKSGHLGLMGIQERAQMLAGTVEIESSPGCGTTVVVEVPYDDSDINRR